MRLSIATITLALHHHTTSAFTTTPPRPHSIINTQTTLFASGGPLNISPIGIGSCAPTTVLTNFDLETVHDTSDEWIRTRTGIEMRRVLVHEGTRSVIAAESDDDDDASEEPETLRSLGITAGRNAISMAGVNPEDIGLVICCTSSPDDLFGDAPSIAAAVG
jgi:3-oxoacyl-[acyl-carrier-protein] synthase-3